MVKGNKITLRNILEKDLIPLYKNTVDLADAGEFMPVTLVSYSSMKRQFETDGFWSDSFKKLLIENNNETLVGEIGLFKSTHYIDGVEIYFRIYASGDRNQGVMTDALITFLRFLFQSESFNRIQAVTVENNIASQKILEKCGFQYEGKLRKARLLKGLHVDLYLYSILRTDTVVQENYLHNL
jgi:ribosomal-protein-alanine N-acetyltransferase